MIRNKISFVLILIIALIFVSCFRNKDRGGIMQFYRNQHYGDLKPRYDSGLTDYSLKIKNTHSVPIVVPFSLYHQIPIVHEFITKKSEDKIVDFIETGVGFIPNLGVDTLLPGETQRYFVDVLNTIDLMEPNS
ncbi:MAG: hypothetical protein ACRBG0_28655, partial [Lewinella sp.]|uniref:hypothetical protein n=1 Tax=Lewinella sp. TaxID=2004506 RepID=UPI003D6BB695